MLKQYSPILDCGIPSIDMDRIETYHFNYPSSHEIQFETTNYPGDNGYAVMVPVNFDFQTAQGSFTRTVNCLIFNSEYGDNEFLFRRLQAGAEMRDKFAITSYTMALFFKENPNVIPGILYSRAHAILRGGGNVKIDEHIDTMECVENNYKRKKTRNVDMFQAGQVKEVNNWLGNTIQLMKEICSASGSTMEQYTKDTLKYSTNLKSIIYVVMTGTTWSIARSVRHIPADIDIFYVTWHGIFQTKRDDFSRPGDKIPGGTIINLLKKNDPNPDSDPANQAILPQGLEEKLRMAFRIDDNDVLCPDDIVGEAGEQNTDEHNIDSIAYDLIWGYATGHRFEAPVWEDKFIHAWEVEGVPAAVEIKSNEAFHYYQTRYLNSVSNKPTIRIN